MGPVQHDQGFGGHHLQAPGNPDLSEPFSHHVLTQRGIEERLCSHQGNRSVIGLVVAVQGKENPVVTSVRGPQLEKLAPHCSFGPPNAKVDPPGQYRVRRLGSEHPGQLDGRLPQH